MSTKRQKHHKSDQFRYLRLKIMNNEHIVVLMDLFGNEFGKGRGLSTIEAINNYYDNDIDFNSTHLFN